MHWSLYMQHFPSFINKYFHNPNYSIIALYVRCIQMTQGTEKSFGRYFKTFPVKMVQIVCILTLHQDIISPFVFPEAKCPGTIGSLSLPISRDTLIQRQWTGWVVWVPHCLRIHTITHNPTTSWWWQQSWEFHLLTPLYEVIWNLINILQTMDKHTEADVHGTEEIKWWTLDRVVDKHKYCNIIDFHRKKYSRKMSFFCHIFC